MKREQGFTLFELLIAIFIGTILIISGAYAIRVGLFSMERGEAWFNDSTREKAAYDFFWQQTSSLRSQKVPLKDMLEAEGNKIPKKKKPIYFRGEKDFLTFISPLSFTRHYGQGLIIAIYEVRLNDNGLWDLIYSELRADPAALIKLSEELESRLSADSDYTVFLKDCDVISFAYLDTVVEETNEETDNEGAVDEEEIIDDDQENIHGRFQDADIIEGTDLKWKEKKKEKVPRAIKLFVSKQGKEQELISPIMVTYSFLASGQ